MSQLERVKEQRKPQDKKSNKKGPQLNNFRSFHPTEGQKDRLRAGAYQLPEVWEVLTPYLQNMCSLSLTYRAENGSYIVILRDKLAAWNEANCLACYQSHPEKALRLLAMALKERYFSFPEWDDDTNVGTEDDW